MMSSDDNLTEPSLHSAAHHLWVLERGFFDALAEVAPSLGLEDHEARVRERLAARRAQCEHLVRNPMDHGNVQFTLLAVALRDVLEPRLELENSLRVVDACLNEPLRPFVLEGTREMLDGADDPFRAVVESSKEREAAAFGPSFTFDRPVDDAHGYVLRIHRCLFHEVLVTCQRTELQPILCRFDLNWADAIDPDAHGFRFVRPTTFATGDTCQMWFMRTRGDVAASRARLPVVHGP